MQNPRLSKKPGIFYGYWIVLAAFCFLFVSSGCGLFVFGLFVNPLQDELHWGRGEIMLAYTLCMIVTGIGSPFVGRVIARYGVKKVVTVGALLTGLGLLILSRADSLWQFFVGYGVEGIGQAAAGLVPATDLVSNWFEKRRGTALGVMATGIGAGGLVMSAVIGGYLIPTFGWRSAYLVMAVFAWVLVIPLALLVIKAKPSDMGLYPDGVKTTEAAPGDETLPVQTGGLTLKMALTTSGLWLAAVAYLLSGFSSIGVMQNQSAYLEDIGLPVATVALALSGVGLGSFVGKFLFGWLCDRILPKYAFAIALCLQVAGIVILMNIESSSPLVLVWLFVTVAGLGVGGWLPTMSMFVSKNFGLAAYGTIFGVVSLVQNIGMATGPLVLGYIYDATGTYHWGFVIYLVLYAVALPAILAARRPGALKISASD